MYSHLTGDESTQMIENIALALTIIVVIHLLMHVVDESVELLDTFTIKIALYIILGIVLFHMIIKKMLL